MTRPADTPLTPDITREVCQRSDSKAYIGGSISIRRLLKDLLCSPSLHFRMNMLR
jgi:hypothetical protein